MAFSGKGKKFFWKGVFGGDGLNPGYFSFIQDKGKDGTAH